MKYKRFLPVIAGILFFISACTQNNNNDVSQVTDGSWKVVYIGDGTDDDLQLYDNYSFSFGPSGAFQAHHTGNDDFTGTWSHHTSSNKLIITIAGNKAMDEISDDWIILEITDTFIKLKDDNTTKDEQLHLQKL